MMSHLKTIVLLGALSAILIGIGGYLAPTYLYLFVGMAILFNFGAYFWSDRIVLRMQGAREVGPREVPQLHATVNDLARRAQIPKPRVYVVPESQPNAFATGRNPAHGAVAVTEGILSMLTERELRGVLAHELAHIKNRDVLVATVAAAIASAVASIANVLQLVAFFGGGGGDDDEDGSPLAALGLAVVAPIAATLVQLGISRTREYQADATGARLTGDPEGLASALAKLQYASERVRAEVQPAAASLFIVNPFAGGGFLTGLFSTHPPMAERIARLRQMQTVRIDRRQLAPM